MEGRDERRPPWLSSDFVMMLVCGIILQLILTLDYGAIARVTKEVKLQLAAAAFLQRTARQQKYKRDRQSGQQVPLGFAEKVQLLLNSGALDEALAIDQPISGGFYPPHGYRSAWASGDCKHKARLTLVHAAQGGR